jgi:DNA-binding NarL/FixJ family response regulator
MKILLIEDHPVVRAGCRRLLEARGDLHVLEAASGIEGLALLQRERPGIVVLDLKLPDANGLEIARQLLAEPFPPKIVVFSMYGDPMLATHPLEIGASGYITKNDDPELLLEAIDKVGRGDIFLTQPMAESLALLRGRADDPLHNLSAREVEVLSLLSQGKTLSQIAADLKVSYRTSASIAAQIRGKLNLTSTAAVIRWALEHLPYHVVSR